MREPRQPATAIAAPLLAAVSFAAVLLAAEGARAADPAARGESDPREVELAAIRTEIGRLEKQLRSLRSREQGIESELERTEVELDLQESRLREAATARELAELAVAQSEARVEELGVALEGVRRDLRRRLAGLYRLGGQGYLRLFLSLEPGESLLPAIRQLRFLARRDQETLERYVRVREELAERAEQLLAERAEIAAWEQRERERRDQLAALRRRQAGLLERLARERRQLAEHAEELQDKARKLARFIDSLLDDTASSLEGTPIGDFHGVLDWPASGEVKLGFGPRRDPRYRTEVPHNGVTLAVEAGTRVKAVFPGSVLFAASFEGYGPMVIVHHPGRVFTLYAGLGELRVAKGDVLSLGDVVGLSADELYFEIRRENQPENPLEWLR